MIGVLLERKQFEFPACRVEMLKTTSDPHWYARLAHPPGISTLPSITRRIESPCAW
jgi:hypothetical protein